MEDPSLENSSALTDFCSLCGFAISDYEKGCILYGEFVDRNLNRGALSITLCRECWLVVWEIEQGGLPRAIAKTRACQSNDRQDVQPK